MTTGPTMAYWHLWTDAEGISRQTRCVMTGFAMKSIAPLIAPQWQGTPTSGAMTTNFMILPAGWIGAWHENPKPQWIVPLSGRWFVEAMDGMRAEMGPGEIAFGGDQNCRAIDGRIGHRSGTLGNEPAVLMVVQLDDRPAPIVPCGLN